MKAIIQANSRTYTIYIDQPLDISIPFRASKENVNAWYLPPPKIYPAKVKEWTGSVKQGAAVNFNTIEFNPHAHGTHTECVGHITKELHTINAGIDRMEFFSDMPYTFCVCSMCVWIKFNRIKINGSPLLDTSSPFFHLSWVYFWGWQIPRIDILFRGAKWN